MEIIDFLRRLYGKITGLNAALTPFYILQMKLNRIFIVVLQQKQCEDVPGCMLEVTVSDISAEMRSTKTLVMKHGL